MAEQWTTCCSSRWPKFSSQHPCLITYNCIYLCILLASISSHTYMAYTYVTCTDILISKGTQLWKRTVRVILKQRNRCQAILAEKSKLPPQAFIRRTDGKGGQTLAIAQPVSSYPSLPLRKVGICIIPTDKMGSCGRRHILKTQSQLATPWFISRVIQPNCSSLPVSP